MTVISRWLAREIGVMCLWIADDLLQTNEDALKTLYIEAVEPPLETISFQIKRSPFI